MMKKSLVVLAASLSVVFLGAAGCGDVTPGSSCSAQGSKHTNKDGYAYTCKDVPGGNRIWQQDGPLTPDRP